VKRLDLVVVSHPHADHFAGLAEIVEAVDVDVLVDRTQVSAPASAAGGSAGKEGGGSPRYASGGSEAREYLRMRATLADSGCRIVRATSGAGLSFHGVAVKFYAPARPLVLAGGEEPWGEGRSPPTGDELNGGSIVAVLEVGGTRFLLPGDAEAETLERYDLPRVDVLVVGHHGSRGAVSKALLDALRPKLAVVSVGQDNSFGHPAAGTLTLLEESAETVLRTDRSGWVSLREKDGAMAVFTERTEAA
jgi:competence protein ComEC